MNCPNCEKAVSSLETWNLSRWKNYRCDECGIESNFTMSYMFMVYTASILLTAITKYMLGAYSLEVSWFISLVIALAYISIIEQLTGKLVLANENT